MLLAASVAIAKMVTVNTFTTTVTKRVILIMASDIAKANITLILVIFIPSILSITSLMAKALTTTPMVNDIPANGKTNVRMVKENSFSLMAR